jgi:hypothetical protein
MNVEQVGGIKNALKILMGISEKRKHLELKIILKCDVRNRAEQHELDLFRLR